MHNQWCHGNACNDLNFRSSLPTYQDALDHTCVTQSSKFVFVPTLSGQRVTDSDMIIHVRFLNPSVEVIALSHKCTFGIPSKYSGAQVVSVLFEESYTNLSIFLSGKPGKPEVEIA